jgi:RNA polymerase sigma factor for flagellar operon FliA
MIANRSLLRDYQCETGVAPDELIASHVSLVHRIAHHLMASLPASVQIDDLIQSGMIGLIEASRQFQSGQGAAFATYAGIRIRGAMIDELRRSDWTPRSVHRNSRRIAEAVRIVENRENRPAQDREVAAVLEITLDDYYDMQQDHVSAHILGFDELFGADTDPDRLLPAANETPNEQVEMDQFRTALMSALAELPEKERLVLALYYDEELNLREIGAVLGITESRVSQIRSQAIQRLRGLLKEWVQQQASA